MIAYRAIHRCGFTLVELLVVIGVIALLISILLPTLNRAREAGFKLKCLSNLRQLGLALLAYENDNQGKFPATARGGGSPELEEDWIWWEVAGSTRTPRDIQHSAI